MIEEIDNSTNINSLQESENDSISSSAQNSNELDKKLYGSDYENMLNKLNISQTESNKNSNIIINNNTIKLYVNNNIITDFKKRIESHLMYNTDVKIEEKKIIKNEDYKKKYEDIKNEYSNLIKKYVELQKLVKILIENKGNNKSACNLSINQSKYLSLIGEKTCNSIAYPSSLLNMEEMNEINMARENWNKTEIIKNSQKKEISEQLSKIKANQKEMSPNNIEKIKKEEIKKKLKTKGFDKIFIDKFRKEFQLKKEEFPDEKIKEAFRNNDYNFENAFDFLTK